MPTNPNRLPVLDDVKLNEAHLRMAAQQVCIGRSDDWDDPEDQQNALDDARVAIATYLLRVAAYG